MVHIEYDIQGKFGIIRGSKRLVPFVVQSPKESREIHMKCQGSVITGQGQPFAIVIVKSFVLNNHSAAKNIQKSLIPSFPGMPVILMANHAKNSSTYFGQDDIVQLMPKIDLQGIVWKVCHAK